MVQLLIQVFLVLIKNQNQNQKETNGNGNGNGNGDGHGDGNGNGNTASETRPHHGIVMFSLVEVIVKETKNGTSIFKIIINTNIVQSQRQWKRTLLLFQSMTSDSCMRS